MQIHWESVVYKCKSTTACLEYVLTRRTGRQEPHHTAAFLDDDGLKMARPIMTDLGMLGVAAAGRGGAAAAAGRGAGDGSVVGGEELPEGTAVRWKKL